MSNHRQAVKIFKQTTEQTKNTHTESGGVSIVTAWDIDQLVHLNTKVAKQFWPWMIFQGRWELLSLKIAVVEMPV